MDGQHRRVLVTGSSGFLGRHVARHLGRSGFDVLGFDLVPSPDAIPSVEGDLCDLNAVRKASEGNDVVVHLGGVGDVDLATRQPDLAAQANVVGTTNVGIAAGEVGARVVYASTWEVYGPPVADPMNEQHPCRPGHIYGATKLGGELVLRALHEHENLSVVILRLGTAYGTWMRPNSVFSRFSEATRRGDPIVIQGTGTQWRQFTHTSDIARAVVLAAESDLADATFNIASDECTTIRHLSELISRRARTDVSFGPDRPGDPPSARVSSDHATELLGWRAEVAFGDGLAELLDFLDAHPASAAAAPR